VARRRKANPLMVEAQRCGRVIFKDPKLACMASLAFNAARFIPRFVRDELDRRGQWPDVANSIYLIVLEFFKRHLPDRFDPKKRSDYKLFVRYVWKSLYLNLKEMLPNYKRRYTLRYVGPSKLRYVSEQDNASGLPFVKEIDLQTSSAKEE
jgi:hypothetical protein